MKLDILVFAAHPDDAELGCGGTIIRQLLQGKSVGIVDLTQGELGTLGDVRTRAGEAAAASELMGLAVRQNLKLADGFFTHNPQNVLRVVEVIRTYRPEIVLANATEDRHPDHGRAARLVSEACFLSGLEKVETRNGSAWQEKWRPSRVFNYIQDRYIKPDFVVDITPVFEKKMEAIRCYSSQFYDPQSNRKEETPISGKDFWHFLEGRAREMGRIIGVEFGEGFTSERIPGVRDLWDII